MREEFPSKLKSASYPILAGNHVLGLGRAYLHSDWFAISFQPPRLCQKALWQGWTRSVLSTWGLLMLLCYHGWQASSTSHGHQGYSLGWLWGYCRMVPLCLCRDVLLNPSFERSGFRPGCGSLDQLYTLCKGLEAQWFFLRSTKHMWGCKWNSTVPPMVPCRGTLHAVWRQESFTNGSVIVHIGQESGLHCCY